MEDTDQAQQALVKMFRRDQVDAESHPERKRPSRFNPVLLAWIVGIAAIVLALAPFTFIAVYPRFGPVDTMTAFCQAESGGDYAVAYKLLSQRVRARVTLADFTQASTSANLISCAPNNGIPFIFGGPSASLDVNFVAGSSGGSLGGTMSFVTENGQWRVDAMTPDMLHLSS